MNNYKLTGGTKVYPRPEPDKYAKRVMLVVCVNPNAKLCYEYDRIFRVTFDDETSIEVGNDYINGHTKVRTRGYVVFEQGKSWGYYSEDDFLAKFSFEPL